MIPIYFQVTYSKVKVKLLFWAQRVVHFRYFNPLVTCLVYVLLLQDSDSGFTNKASFKSQKGDSIFFFLIWWQKKWVSGDNRFSISYNLLYLCFLNYLSDILPFFSRLFQWILYIEHSNYNVSFNEEKICRTLPGIMSAK